MAEGKTAEESREMEGASRIVQTRKGGLRTMPFIFGTPASSSSSSASSSATVTLRRCSERDSGEAGGGGLLGEHDQLLDQGAPHAAGQGRHHAHQLRRHRQPDAAAGGLPRRRLPGPLLDHHRRLRHLPAGHGLTDPVGGAAAAPPAAVRRERTLQGSLRRAAGRPLRVPPSELPRRRRYTPLRGGLRRRPVRRIRSEAEDEDVELLQLVLLLHGGLHPPRRHRRGLRAGQRQLGLGPRHPHLRHGRLPGLLRRRLPPVPPPRPRRQPLHQAVAGCRRRREEAPPAAGHRLHSAVRKLGARRPHLPRRQAHPHRKPNVPGQGGGGGGGGGGGEAEPMEAEHGAPGGGAEVADEDGAHMGGGDLADHGGGTAGDLLPAAGSHHGPPPVVVLVVPDPAGFHGGLHHPVDARHHRRLRPRPHPRRPASYRAPARNLLPDPHGRGLRHLRPRHACRRLRGGEAAARRRRARAARPAPCHRAHLRLLARAAVRAARHGGGLLRHRPPRVLLRPGTGEHAELGDGALLARHLRRQLPQLPHRLPRPPLQRRPGGLQLAAGQPQQGPAGESLLDHHLPPAPEPRLLRRLRPLLHLQAPATAPGWGPARGLRGAPHQGVAAAPPHGAAVAAANSASWQNNNPELGEGFFFQLPSSISLAVDSKSVNGPPAYFGVLRGMRQSRPNFGVGPMDLDWICVTRH